MKLNISQKQLTIWNISNKKPFGISYNENWNKAIGLPDENKRYALRKLHSHYFGLEHGSLTIKQIKEALGDDPIFYGVELEEMRKALIK